jgi:hypothetical protein
LDQFLPFGVSLHADDGGFEGEFDVVPCDLSRGEEKLFRQPREHCLVDEHSFGDVVLQPCEVGPKRTSAPREPEEIPLREPE